MPARFGFVLACTFLLSCSPKDEQLSPYVLYQSQSEIEFRATMLQIRKCQVAALAIMMLDKKKNGSSFKNKLYTINRYKYASIANRQCSLTNSELNKLVCMNDFSIDSVINGGKNYDDYLASCDIKPSESKRLDACNENIFQFEENYINPAADHWAKNGGSYKDLNTKSPTEKDYKIYFASNCPY